MFKLILEDRELIFETVEEVEEYMLIVYIETGEMGKIEFVEEGNITEIKNVVAWRNGK